MSSITIPDSLPEILKNYVKAAIRSQPEDIISWSAEYFKTTDDQSTTIGLYENNSTYKQDRTLFRILAFQLGTTIGTKERIEEVWSDLSLDFNLLEQIYRIGKFHLEHVDMVEFLGIAFGHWTKSLKDTMSVCCEAFCKCLATDGYFLHVDVACKLYEFLAKLDCSLPDNVGDGPRRTSVDNDNDASRSGRMMKSSMSLDVPSPTLNRSSSPGDMLKSDFCVSLDSVFVPVTNGQRATDNKRPAADNRDHTGYHVPGIGPVVPDARVQKVLEYFRKCATDNSGYVYEFDIENDSCPRLDAN